MDGTETKRGGGLPPMVLVADDDPVMNMLITEVLRTAGYTVVGATDGVSALDLARSKKPDAIVIDLLMPGLSGTQVLRELRTRHADRRIPVIMISGIDDVGHRVQALDAGANDFLVKPVAPSELVARVDAQLRSAAMSADDVDSTRSSWRRGVVENQSFDVAYEPVVDIRSGQVAAKHVVVRFHDRTQPDDALYAGVDDASRRALEWAVLERAIEGAPVDDGSAPLLLKASQAMLAAPELTMLLERAGRPCHVETYDAALVGVAANSLARIVETRPDVVTIDATIVSLVHEDPARQALVSGLVQFSAATGCTLVAAGVTSAAQRQALLSLGVELASGELFLPPANSWPAPNPVQRIAPLSVVAG